jgi:hypothetical protein
MTLEMMPWELYEAVAETLEVMGDKDCLINSKYWHTKKKKCPFFDTMSRRKKKG